MPPLAPPEQPHQLGHKIFVGPHRQQRHAQATSERAQFQLPGFGLGGPLLPKRRRRGIDPAHQPGFGVAQRHDAQGRKIVVVRGQQLHHHQVVLPGQHGQLALVARVDKVGNQHDERAAAQQPQHLPDARGHAGVCRGGGQAIQPLQQRVGGAQALGGRQIQLFVVAECQQPQGGILAGGGQGQPGQGSSEGSGEPGEGAAGSGEPFTGCGSASGGEAAPCELPDGDDFDGQAPAATAAEAPSESA